MAHDYIFTSEAVTPGHPDKLCDRISDAILDRFLRDQPDTRVVAECAVAKGIVFVAASFGGAEPVDVGKVARRVIRQAGYSRPDFNSKTCSIMTSLTELPAAEPVPWETLDDDAIERLPAREQVTVFGYACAQTPDLMPLPIHLAHRLARALAEARHRLPYLAPDGKTQVAVVYRDGRPMRIHSLSLIAATLPDWEWDQAALSADLQQEVVVPAFAGEPITPDGQTRVLLNPGGPFRVGGPSRHSGMTGRKTAMDTYGEYARHSASALSGKDPSRIDRSGAYAARYAAKNVVAAGLAGACEVQLSYAIGSARPVSCEVRCFGTGRLADPEIAARLQRCLDFRVAAVVRRFHLRLRRSGEAALYAPLAAYGHFGRPELDLPWEMTDIADCLQE